MTPRCFEFISIAEPLGTGLQTAADPWHPTKGAHGDPCSNHGRAAQRAKYMAGIFALLVLLASPVRGADEKPGTPAQPVAVKYRITGLFSPDREADLREAAKKIPDIALSEIDYANGEVSFSYDSSKVLKGAKPDHVQNHINNLLRNASNHTFGLKPLSTIPREKLQRVEISVGVLDCKACGYGLYQIVSAAPGVEQATANYKEGLVTAWIDPETTDRAKLIEVLKKREIRVIK